MRGTARRPRRTTPARRRECDRALRRALRVSRALRQVRRPPGRRLRRGTVVWADVPFADTDGWKLRPALVTGRTGETVRLHPISSALSRLGREGYLELDDLDAAGLDRPCGVNLLREVEVPFTDVVDIAGELSGGDGIRFEVHAALLAVMARPSTRA